MELMNSSNAVETHVHDMSSCGSFVRSTVGQKALTQPVTYTHAGILDQYFKASFKRQCNKLLGTFDGDTHTVYSFC